MSTPSSFQGGQSSIPYPPRPSSLSSAEPQLHRRPAEISQPASSQPSNPFPSLPERNPAFSGSPPAAFRDHRTATPTVSPGGRMVLRQPERIGDRKNFERNISLSTNSDCQSTTTTAGGGRSTSSGALGTGWGSSEKGSLSSLGSGGGGGLVGPMGPGGAGGGGGSKQLDVSTTSNTDNLSPSVVLNSLQSSHPQGNFLAPPRPSHTLQQPHQLTSSSAAQGYARDSRLRARGGGGGASLINNYEMNSWSSSSSSRRAHEEQGQTDLPGMMNNRNHGGGGIRAPGVSVCPEGTGGIFRPGASSTSSVVVASATTTESGTTAVVAVAGNLTTAAPASSIPSGGGGDHGGFMLGRGNERPSSGSEISLRSSLEGAVNEYLEKQRGLQPGGLDNGADCRNGYQGGMSLPGGLSLNNSDPSSGVNYYQPPSNRTTLQGGMSLQGGRTSERGMSVPSVSSSHIPSRTEEGRQEETNHPRGSVLFDPSKQPYSLSPLPGAASLPQPPLPDRSFVHGGGMGFLGGGGEGERRQPTDFSQGFTSGAAVPQDLLREGGLSSLGARTSVRTHESIQGTFSEEAQRKRTTLPVPFTTDPSSTLSGREPSFGGGNSSTCTADGYERQGGPLAGSSSSSPPPPPPPPQFSSNEHHTGRLVSTQQHRGASGSTQETMNSVPQIIISNAYATDNSESNNRSPPPATGQQQSSSTNQSSVSSWMVEGKNGVLTNRGIGYTPSPLYTTSLSQQPAPEYPFRKISQPSSSVPAPERAYHPYVGSSSTSTSQQVQSSSSGYSTALPLQTRVGGEGRTYYAPDAWREVDATRGEVSSFPQRSTTGQYEASLYPQEERRAVSTAYSPSPLYIPQNINGVPVPPPVSHPPPSNTHSYSSSVPTSSTLLQYQPVVGAGLSGQTMNSLPAGRERSPPAQGGYTANDTSSRMMAVVPYNGAFSQMRGGICTASRALESQVEGNQAGRPSGFPPTSMNSTVIRGGGGGALPLSPLHGSPRADGGSQRGRSSDRSHQSPFSSPFSPRVTCMQSQKKRRGKKKRMWGGKWGEKLQAFYGGGGGQSCSSGGSSSGGSDSEDQQRERQPKDSTGYSTPQSRINNFTYARMQGNENHSPLSSSSSASPSMGTFAGHGPLQYAQSLLPGRGMVVNDGRVYIPGEPPSATSASIGGRNERNSHTLSPRFQRPASSSPCGMMMMLSSVSPSRSEHHGRKIGGPQSKSESVERQKSHVIMYYPSASPQEGGRGGENSNSSVSPNKEGGTSVKDTDEKNRTHTQPPSQSRGALILEALGGFVEGVVDHLLPKKDKQHADKDFSSYSPRLSSDYSPSHDQYDSCASSSRRRHLYDSSSPAGKGESSLHRPSHPLPPRAAPFKIPAPPGARAAASALAVGEEEPFLAPNCPRCTYTSSTQSEDGDDLENTYARSRGLPLPRHHPSCHYLRLKQGERMVSIADEVEEELQQARMQRDPFQQHDLSRRSPYLGDRQRFYSTKSYAVSRSIYDDDNQDTLRERRHHSESPPRRRQYLGEDEDRAGWGMVGRRSSFSCLQLPSLSQYAHDEEGEEHGRRGRSYDVNTTRRMDRDLTPEERGRIAGSVTAAVVIENLAKTAKTLARVASAAPGVAASMASVAAEVVQAVRKGVEEESGDNEEGVKNEKRLMLIHQAGEKDEDVRRIAKEADVGDDRKTEGEISKEREKLIGTGESSRKVASAGTTKKEKKTKEDDKASREKTKTKKKKKGGDKFEEKTKKKKKDVKEGKSAKKSKKQSEAKKEKEAPVTGMKEPESEEEDISSVYSSSSCSSSSLSDTEEESSSPPTTTQEEEPESSVEEEEEKMKGRKIKQQSSPRNTNSNRQLTHEEENPFEGWVSFGQLWQRLILEDCCVEEVQRLKKVFDRFSSSSSSSSPPFLSRESFHQLFTSHYPACIPSAEHIDFFFEALDRHRENKVYLRDFRLGLYVSQPEIVQDLSKASGLLRMQLIFRAYDLDADGFLSTDELKGLLGHLHAAGLHTRDRQAIKHKKALQRTVQSEANLLLSRFTKFSYTAFLSCVTSGVFNSTHRLLRCSKSLPKLIKEEEQAKKKKRNTTTLALPSSHYPDRQAPHVESVGQSLYHQGQNETEAGSLPPPTADRRSPSPVGWQLQPIQQQQQPSCSPPSSRDVYASQSYSMLPQEPLPANPQQVLAAAYPSPSTQFVPSPYLSQVMNSQGRATIASPPSAPSGGTYTLQNPALNISSSHAIMSPPQQAYSSSVLPNQPSGTIPPHSQPVPHRPQDSFRPTQSNFISQPTGPPMPSPPLPFPVPAQGGGVALSPSSPPPPLPRDTMVIAAHPPHIQESFPSVYQGQQAAPLATGGVRSCFPEKVRDGNDDVDRKRAFDEKARQGLVGEEGIHLGISAPNVVSSLSPPSDTGYVELPQAYSSVQRLSAFEKRSLPASSPTHCFRGGRAESYDLITGPLRGRHGNPLKPVTSPEPPIARKAVYPIPTPGQTTLAQRILRNLRSRLCGNSKEETESLISKYLQQGGPAIPHSQQERSPFPLIATPDEILTILEAVKCIFSVETTVLEVNLPAKIFGDLHGHLADLLEFFRSFGWPDEVDKTTRQYEDFLFLGDYVDRGECSLEVILILFSLKILFPSRVFLLRGNHEDRAMNADYGFAAEIEKKLGVYGGDFMKARLVWQCANDVFDFLPLGAHLPAARIFCLHGCLGNSIRLIDDLRGLTRPIQVAGTDIDRKALQGIPSSSPFSSEETEKMCLVLDCLWSDPERPPDNKEDVAGPDSPRGAHAIRSSAEFIREFLKRNQLHLLIRAHECVLPGYCYDLDGGCLTLFSASNYCGRYQNDGAALHVYREEELVEGGGEEDESPHGAMIPRQPRPSDHITWHILLVEFHRGNEERSNGSKTHQFYSSCVPSNSLEVTRPSPPCSPPYPPLPFSSHPSGYPIPVGKNPQKEGEPSLVDFSSPVRETGKPTQPRQPLPFPTHAPSAGIAPFGSYQPDLSIQNGSPSALTPSAIQGLSSATAHSIGNVTGLEKPQGGEKDHSLSAQYQYAELARLAAEAVNSPASGRSPSPSPLPPFPSSSEAALLLSSALAASSSQATKSSSPPFPVGLLPSTLLSSPPSSLTNIAPTSGASQVLPSTSNPCCPQAPSGVYHPGPPSVIVSPPASPHHAVGLQVPGPLVEIPSEFLRSAGSASDAHDSFPIQSNPLIPSLSPDNTRIDSPCHNGDGLRQVMMGEEGERQQGVMNSNPISSSCRVTPRDEFPENDNPSRRSPPFSSSSLPNPFRQNTLQLQQPSLQDDMNSIGYSHNHNSRGSRTDEVQPNSHGHLHRPEPLSPSVAVPRAPSGGNRDVSLSSSSPFIHETSGPCPDDNRNTPRGVGGGGEATTSHPLGSFSPPGSPHWIPQPHTPQSTMRDRVRSVSPHHSRHTSPTGPPTSLHPVNVSGMRRARDEEEEERRCSPRSPHWRAVHGILSPTSRPEHNRFPTRSGENTSANNKDDEEDGLNVVNSRGHSVITGDGPSSSYSSPRIPTHRRPRRRSLPLLCDFDGQPFPLPSDLRPQANLKSLSPRPSSSSLVGGAEPHRGRREEDAYHLGDSPRNNHTSITAQQPAYAVVGGPGGPSSPPAPPVRRTSSRTEVERAVRGIDHARLGRSSKSLRGDDVFASSPPFPYAAPQSHRLQVPSSHVEEESVYSFGAQEGNSERRRRRGTEGDQDYNGQLLGPCHLPPALTRGQGAEGGERGARRIISSGSSSSSRAKINPWKGRETRAEDFEDEEFDRKAQDTSSSEKEKKGRRKWSGFFSRRGSGNKGGGKEEEENPDAVLAAFSKTRRRSNPR
ncbi:ser thr phosphatase family protein [Cystoisospora suis]|uniref:Serine/threonine-protein phosphatase n=1 Tax=Cystoisospora suis TaxID=483139 RepID=A0A2C6L750_9APIC|nr:ser thr phosphatase family protein [Cystoisospora suis]